MKIPKLFIFSIPYKTILLIRKFSTSKRHLPHTQTKKQNPNSKNINLLTLILTFKNLRCHITLRSIIPTIAILINFT